MGLFLNHLFFVHTFCGRDVFEAEEGEDVLFSFHGRWSGHRLFHDGEGMFIQAVAEF